MRKNTHKLIVLKFLVEGGVMVFCMICSRLFIYLFILLIKKLL